MSKYRAVLFSPDGEDWVTDHPSETVEEVWDKLADQGSRWIFYPICAVVRDHAVMRDTLRIVDGCETHGPDFYINTEEYKGQTIRAVMRDIADLIA